MHRHVKPGLTWESLLLLGTKMGKRSDFARRPQDTYDTPAAAVEPLLPFLQHWDGRRKFIEPCAGSGQLIRHLQAAGHQCVGASDIEPRGPGIVRMDVLDLDPRHAHDADLIITNPPWQRELLHQIIAHLRTFDRPYWLLIDANWMFTGQAAPFLRYCKYIVTIGRVRWIPGTTMSGKDDAAWFLFMPRMVPITIFYSKKET